MTVFSNFLENTLFIITHLRWQDLVEFEFEGVLGDEVDAAMPAPTYPTDNKLKAAGGPATFDGVNICMESMSLELANSLYVRECSGPAKGYEYTVITDRKPKVTGTPESKLVAAQDRMQLFRNGTEKVLRYTVPAPGYNSGTGAKAVDFLATLAQISELKEGDRSGVSIDDINWMLNQSLSTGDDDFSITFNI